MRTHRNIASTALLAPLIALVGCNAGPFGTGSVSASDPAGSSTSGADTNAVTPTTGATGEPSGGPREPLPNSVSATFIDPAGNPLPGAWVQRLDPAPDPERVAPSTPPTNLPSPLTADAGGHIVAEALLDGEQRWMIGAPGFVTRTEVFNLAPGAQTSHTFRLTPLGKTFEIDTGAASDLIHDGAMVHLPSGPMVSKRTGEQYTGPVQATLTVVKPGPDNQDAPPVPLIGEDIFGGSGQLISFAMVGVELRTPNGQPLELGDDVTASVSIELSAEQSAMIDELGVKVIPAWHADPARGETIWKEIGVFILGAKNDQGRYIATTHSVKKFSWINTDLKSEEPRCYEIKVVDAQDQPIPGQNVDISYNFPLFGFTGPDGTVCFDMAVDTLATVMVPNAASVEVKAKQGDPKSVCPENNRPWYDGYPKGNCTEVVIKVDNTNVCVPGSTWDCSDEKPFPDLNMDGVPDDLDSQGICKAAYKICADGSKWSACLDPVLPQDEVCTLDGIQLDENCNKIVNEPTGLNCICTPGEERPCYTGNPEDIDPILNPNSACQPGKQVCTGQSEWGECNLVLPKLPDFPGEDCDPGDKNESCSPTPCEFDPLWWHSLGATGSHNALATHLEEGLLTAVTYVNEGDTDSHGSCFNIVNGFRGVTLARFPISNQDEPPNCDANQANLIEGRIDSGTVSGAANAQGTAVAGRVTDVLGNEVKPDAKAVLAGCGDAIPGGRYFVARHNINNVCMFRSVATGDAAIKDVAVNVDAKTRAYLAIEVPAGKSGGIENCAFPVHPQKRAYYVRLEKVGDAVQCKSTAAYLDETPNVIDVDTSGALAAAGTVAEKDVRVRLLDGELNPVWAPMEPVAAFTPGGLQEFMPLGISSRNQRIAVIGYGTGSFTPFQALNPAIDVGPNDTDLVLLVSDPAHPQRGTSLLGSGGQNNDLGDFGYAVEWVDYHDPDTYEKFDALVVAGTSMSKDFVFGDCWTDVNPDDIGAQLYDSFVGVLKHSPGQSFTQDSCAEHHPITALGSQVVLHLAVDFMRVALCGWHNADIEVHGQIVEDFQGDNKNAHCGAVVLPVKPPA